MKNIFLKILINPWKRILFFFITISIVFILLSVLIPEQTGIDETYLFFISIIIISGIIETLRPNSKWYAFGLNINRTTLKYLFFGFLMSFIPMALFLVIKLNAGYIYLGISFNNFSNFISFTLLIFIYATLEELIFRGIIFQSLIERINPVLVSMLFSLIFASGHILNNHSDLISFINTFLAGILLSFMYLQTKSLWLPISFHFFWNWLQKIMLDSNISGNFFDITVVDLGYPQDVFSNRLITGGYYGPEASAVTTIFLIILIFITTKISLDPYQNSILLKRKYKESELRHNN